MSMPAQYVEEDHPLAGAHGVAAHGGLKTSISLDEGHRLAAS